MAGAVHSRCGGRTTVQATQDSTMRDISREHARRKWWWRGRDGELLL